MDADREGKINIVYLPPMTVASIHVAEGEGSEEKSAEIMDKFIMDVNLKEVFPSARNFGFSNPDGVPDDDPAHGYERWISIPEDMEVSEPMVKKHLCGGIYAAHMIPMGAWDEGWVPLHEWVSESQTKTFAGIKDEKMHNSPLYFANLPLYFVMMIRYNVFTNRKHAMFSANDT